MRIGGWVAVFGEEESEEDEEETTSRMRLIGRTPVANPQLHADPVAIRVTTTVVVEPVPVPAPPPEPPPTEPSTTTTTTAPPDTSGPSVSISGPACVTWGGSGTFNASASDPSGISSLTISWSGATSGSKSTGGSSLSVSLGFTSPMTGITFSAVAVDGAGNTGRASWFASGGPTCA
jgi:hypothetical protein